MTQSFRKLVLRSHAIYFGLAAAVSLVALDFQGIVRGTGPEARLLDGAPLAGIGFVEAHGLALIFAILFWRATPSRMWHVTAAAVAGLLGTCNLLFWEGFVVTDSVAMGTVATGLHLLFAMLQFAAASLRRADLQVRQDAGPEGPAYERTGNAR